MSALQITVSEEINRQAMKLAAESGLTVEQFVARAVEAQVAALNSEEYWKARAARGNPNDLTRILDMAPDVPPMLGDEISPDNAEWVEKTLRQSFPKN